jgi:hypothetical protein
MLDPVRLAQALGGKANGNVVSAPGPGHSAEDLSLTVWVDPGAPDGFRVHSHSGDDPISCRDHVRKLAGLPAFAPRRKAPVFDIASFQAAVAAQQQEAPKGRIVKTYDYADASGKLLYQACRLEPKSFRQRRPNGNGGWIWQLGEQRVLYRLADLLKYPDATVFVTEGEKDADRVAELGQCATTVASGKWTDDCVQALAGRDVFIVEDNDEAGRKKAAEAALALHGTAKSIRIVRLPDLPEKGDVSDWLDADRRNADRLVDVCLAAPEWTPEATETNPEPDAAPKSSVPRFRFETMADLRTMPSEVHLIDGWIPERSVGLLYGRWGSGKTFTGFDWLLHLGYGMKDWHGAMLPGVPCDVLAIAREGHSGFVKRVSAFKSHHNLTDDPERLLFMRSPVSFLDDASFAALKEDIKALERPFRFVLVDTVARVIPGADMGKEAPITLLMERLQQVGELTGGTAVGVHHENKSGDVNGSMFFQNNSDFMFNTEREGEGSLERGRITCVKQKDGNDPWSREIEFAKVVLPDGQSSLVVESVSQTDSGVISRNSVSAKNRRALDALDEVVLSHGRPSPIGISGVTVAEIERWRQELLARGIIDKDAKNPRTDFKRIKDSLADSGLIGERDGLVWRVK